MNHDDYLRVYHEDNLVIRFKRADGSVGFKGKRVGKDCPLSASERREYVEKGAIMAVKFIREFRSLSIREAKDLLDKARGTPRKIYSRFNREYHHA